MLPETPSLGIDPTRASADLAVPPAAVTRPASSTLTNHRVPVQNIDLELQAYTRPSHSPHSASTAASVQHEHTSSSTGTTIDFLRIHKAVLISAALTITVTSIGLAGSVMAVVAEKGKD